MQPYFYMSFPTPFGSCSIVWQESPVGPRVQRVFLPSQKGSMQHMLRSVFPDLRSGHTPQIAELIDRMQTFLKGQALAFDLKHAALENCSDFQQRVLKAEHAVPRGSVTTYARLAGHLGIAAGARAVGRALATNPFPIIIPCHRAIQSGGGPGGYQGGIKMKRTLLAYEGIEFSASGKVLMKKIYY